jgi:hypothetical protein
MTFAWVIVHDASPPGAPIYYTGARTPALRWSNPGAWEYAVRFARKEDAEAIAILAGFYAPNPTHKIEEHGFEADKPNDPIVDDLAMLVQRCINLLPDSTLKNQAADFLKRKGLLGNLLRTDAR